MAIKVKIYKPSRSAVQSAKNKASTWILEYEQVSARNPDDLTGWSSSSDTLNQVKLKFPTFDQAVDYARKNGFLYSVTPEQEEKISPKNYVDNFKYFPPEEKSAK